MRISPRRSPLLTATRAESPKSSSGPAKKRRASGFTPAKPPAPTFDLPGLSTLPAALQAKVKALHEGKSLLATRFRMMETQLKSQADYLAATPELQGQYVLGALDAALPGTVQPEPRTHVPTPPAVTRGATRVVDAFEFHGATARAEVFDVVVEGQTITVAAPADGHFTPPVQHSFDDVVRTLAALPEASRKQITSVHLNPVANPDDAFWAQTYGIPEAVSYMTCGAEGGVTIYPANAAQPAETMAVSMIHETGHAWSMKAWGDAGTGPGWDAWSKAIETDVVRVSTYGNSSLLEDAAETTALYLWAKGTPHFDEYRALYPARFAILDRELGGRS